MLKFARVYNSRILNFARFKLAHRICKKKKENFFEENDNYLKHYLIILYRQFVFITLLLLSIDLLAKSK